MKKMLLTVLAASVALSAAFVPVDRAKTVAVNQYKQYCADASTKSANVVNVVENVYEGEVTWYAFEFDKGFVIVSADDSVRPILGYSDHGNVPKADKLGGHNFKEWFGKYDREIAFMRKNNVVDKVGAQTWKDIEANVFASTKAGVVVDRLCGAQWDQTWPWNDLCPEKDGTFTYVGCVATAMAIITKYHRWPDVGVGTKSYTWNGQTLSANFATHSWNYDLMPEVLNIEYGLYPEYWESYDFTQAEVDELALQSYWMGLSVNMNYGTTADGGSGAYMTAVDDAYRNNWKGSSVGPTSFATPPAGGTDASYATIIAELNAKRPWQWAGGVHSFLLDGYRDDYWYHFNWGWGGSYDGWFHRSSLIPGGIGSGGGDGDFTSGQQGITYIPNTNPYTAWPATTVSGSIANGEDITVNWTAQTGAVSYELYRTFNKEGVPTLITTTTALTYSQYDLPAGEYAYSVIVNYASGKSHISNAYSATVAIQGNFKTPTAFSGVKVGRTKIDLSWVKPYTGVTYADQNFETGTLAPWERIASAVFTSSVNNRGWTADDGTRWQLEDGTFLDPSYIHDGNFSAAIGYSAGGGTNFLLSWLYSPSFTMGSNARLKFWIWYNNNAAQGWYTDIYFCWYKGPFTERTGVQIANNTYQAAYWQGSVLGEAGNNKWASEVDLDLSSQSGTTGRLAFVYKYTDGYQLAVDDIICGTDSGGIPEPTGYEVFRAGSKIADVSGATTTTYSDTGFADGNNTYYVRAVYPTGTSIPSIYKTVFMDANPRPNFLTGTGGASAQLSWYYPYHNPPKWYVYYDVTKSNTTVDRLDTDICDRRRVLFVGSQMGFYYPATIDSIAAGFYEWSDDPWSTNQFRFRIHTGGYGSMETQVYESGLLTAVPGQVYKHALPTPIEVTGSFNVEVAASGTTTGHPANLAGYSEDGQVHSYFYYTAESSFFYYIISGSNTLEYFITAHVISAAPPAIAKSGWVSASGSELTKPLHVLAEDIVAEGIPYETKITRTIDGPVKGVKAMDYYKIYRNDVEIGTSTTLSYEDTSVQTTGDYTYKVTAVYSNPAGESAASNEIVLNVEGGSGPVIPAVPAPITTSIVSGNVKFDWPDMADATSYDVYSSANPYGTFAFVTNVAVSEYTYTPTETKMFFQFVSKNSTKESPKTIEVRKTSSAK